MRQKYKSKNQKADKVINNTLIINVLLTVITNFN